jgi:hypothetical protein
MFMPLWYPTTDVFNKEVLKEIYTYYCKHKYWITIEQFNHIKRIGIDYNHITKDYIIGISSDHWYWR